MGITVSKGHRYTNHVKRPNALKNVYVSFRKHKRKLPLYIICSILVVWWIVIPFVCDQVIYRMYINRLEKCTNGDRLRDHMTIQIENGAKKVVFNCIPSVPALQSSLGWHVPTIDDSITEKYLRLPANLTFKDRVVILCPLRDSANFLQSFREELVKISYPHNLISVHFGEEGSTDDTLEVAIQIAYELENVFGFHSAKVHQLPIQGNNSTRLTRHLVDQQYQRRSHLAKVRNYLTKLALNDEDWVLWIDCDVYELRTDTIQQFLFLNRDVMAASALLWSVRYGYSTFRVYDRNTRRMRLDEDKRNQYSIYLPDLKAEGREAKINLVGACVLMIRAECIRKGLLFPEVPYLPNGVMIDNEGLESEGLGQMATQMGFQVYGLPFLEVKHVYEPRSFIGKHLSV